ncbi:hypothetical protein [Caulobacter vibrioides]|uniref:hypothetical protein n=1 Tax=Caulobacter vibrioides TaxID=155892 RepID=UPI000BB4FC10|nr:hypothetical protein [Caulobacter vibrioides]ATC26507.1 hypothetical protein CA608_19220 [Caulobacter vibrioides]PLR12329.1 hypothetical protein CVUC_08850 [Caulobacter vibrioides]
MALGIPEFTTQLAALQAQFAAGDLTQEALATALRALWEQYDSVLTLADNIQSLLAIKEAILDAYQAGIGLKGTVSAVSELPAAAAEGSAYKLVNVLDVADGHLFARISGAWVDLGLLTGPKGRSAYEVAVANGFEGTEEQYAALPLNKADLAQEKADLADGKATFAQEQGDYAKGQGDYAKGQGDDAQAAAAAANLARDVARFKAIYLTRSALFADLAHEPNVLGLVADDPTPGYNGTYLKLGQAGVGTWSKVDSVNGLTFQELPRDTGYLAAFCDAAGRPAWLVRLDGAFEVRKIVMPAGILAGASLSPGTVDASKLEATIQSSLTRIPVESPVEETGYVYAITDAAKRLLFGIARDGSTYIPKFSPLTALIPKDLSVTSAKLATDLAALIASPMLASETGYVWTITDAANRLLAGIKRDGTFYAAKFELKDASITETKFSAEVRQLMATSLSPESGYVYAIVDAANRRLFGIRTDGTLVGKFENALNDGAVTTLKIASGAVTEAKLDPPMARLAVPRVGDVIEVPPDAWRSKLGSVAVRTEAIGSLWVQFPRFMTKALRGLNAASTSIDFRKSSGLSFRGKRQGNDWSPVATTAVPSLINKGNTTDPSALSTAGRVLGDYYRYSVTSGTTTFDGQTVGLGDLIVYDGSAFRVQKGPTPPNGGGYTSRERGDWWIVTADGTFDGVSYVAGDRIVCIGFDSQSGFGVMLWFKGKPAEGDLFYRGEHDASGGAYPTSPAHGDTWQISVAGTLSGEVFAANDYLIYDSGVWGRVPGNPITTVASGKMIPGLSCVQSASEWEVRRTDKSNTRVGVTAAGRHQLSPRRSSDGIVCRSDSMFGVAAIQTNLGNLVTPRQVVAIARGGGTSDNVLATMEHEIANGGDPYRGWFEFIWQGQNNQPGAVGDANWCRTIEAALRIAELIGVRDSRFAFLSILGSMAMTFDGTRINCTQWEPMQAGTHVLAKLEDWYATNFPGQFVNTRKVLLAKAAASTVPDPRVLGAMTEAQTAAAYGWVPYSWMNKNTAYSFSLVGLNYIGWWSGAGTLPTGGADGDAYVRSAGATTIGTGGVGNLIVRQSGAWGEYAPDTIHIGGGATQGGPQLAAALNDHLITTKL